MTNYTLPLVHICQIRCKFRIFVNLSSFVQTEYEVSDSRSNPFEREVLTMLGQEVPMI